MNPEYWTYLYSPSFTKDHVKLLLFLVYFNFSVGHTKTPSHDKFIRDDSRKTGPIGIVHHLQKTMSGGIMLMELSFREQYFCAKLYICEYSRLGTPVNQHVCIYTEQNFHFMLNVVFS